jgi:3',5'-cyclic AMP phosphodiesterase CpdA
MRLPIPLSTAPNPPSKPTRPTDRPAGAFTLAQLSDPHLGPLIDVRWRELASKRILGYINWRRSRSAARGPKTLRALIDDLRTIDHDHLAVTGDLVNIGLNIEIDAALTWLESLGNPHDVTVVPGNHDAYLPNAIRQFERAWRPFMLGDDNPRGAVVFPFTRQRGPVGIVGVSTAVATAPFMATGSIRQPQADQLAAELTRLGEQGLFRVVLIHHPPAIGSTTWERRLIGARIFRDAVKRSGAELVLHGHNHRISIDAIAGPDGPIPVVGAASASLRSHRGRRGGSYLLFRIHQGAEGFTCDMTERGAREPDGPIETLFESRLATPAGQSIGTRIQA